MRPPHPHTPLPPWTLDFHHEWLLRGGGDAIVRIAESISGSCSWKNFRDFRSILRAHSSPPLFALHQGCVYELLEHFSLSSFPPFLPSFPFLSFSGSGSGSFIPYIRCSARCEYRIDAYFVKVYVYIRVYPVYL